MTQIAKNNDSIPILRPDRKKSVIIIVIIVFQLLFVRFNRRLPLGRVVKFGVLPGF